MKERNLYEGFHSHICRTINSNRRQPLHADAVLPARPQWLREYRGEKKQIQERNPPQALHTLPYSQSKPRTITQQSSYFPGWGQAIWFQHKAIVTAFPYRFFCILTSQRCSLYKYLDIVGNISLSQTANEIFQHITHGLVSTWTWDKLGCIFVPCLTHPNDIKSLQSWLLAILLPALFKPLVPNLWSWEVACKILGEEYSIWSLPASPQNRHFPMYHQRGQRRDQSQLQLACHVIHSNSTSCLSGLLAPKSWEPLV